jgi:rhodanese-related sulfurtransferase
MGIAIALADGVSAVAETREAAGNLRSEALGLVEAQIARVFGDVNHMTPAALAMLLRERPDKVVLLDVRALDEHAVSRLPGGVHISPETRSAAAVEATAGSLEGKIVVAYCAIGLRSSRLIVRIGQALRERGVVELHNLAGGAFRWRNEGRPLVDANGPTRAMHPYSTLWRQLLIEATEPTAPAR